jgi:hypothetical protein
MWIVSFLVIGDFIYGHFVMVMGLGWAVFSLLFALFCQLQLTESVFLINPPTHYVFTSAIDPSRKVHLKARPPLAVLCAIRAHAAQVVSPASMPKDPKPARVRSDTIY